MSKKRHFRPSVAGLLGISAVVALWLGGVSYAAPMDFDLYYSPGFGQTGVLRLDLELPDTAEEIVPGNLLNTSTSLALDFADRKLYWVADTQLGGEDKIRRSNLDGSEVELFLTPAGQPADIQINPFNGLLYYSERGTNAIHVVNVDGTNHQTLISTVEPRGLDLDLVNGHIYWVEFASNRLRRANLDGSGVVDVVTTGMIEPFDVAVDPVRERLYWVELGPDTDEGRVWTASLDGSNPMLIADNQRQPADIRIDEARQSVYWGDESGNALRRADFDGSNLGSVPATDIARFRNFVLDAPPIVPEPSCVSLAATALAGLIGLAWRQRQFGRVADR